MNNVDSIPSCFALMVWIGRTPIRLAPALVGQMARVTLTWLRRYQPQELDILREEFFR